MHTVQQVWVLRRGRATRCPVHLTAQCRQREDIRFPLVLVRHTWFPHFHYPHISNCYHILSKNARLYDANALQTCSER